VENWEIMQVTEMLAFLDEILMSPRGRVIKIVLKLFIFLSERLIVCNNSGLCGSGSPNRFVAAFKRLQLLHLVFRHSNVTRKMS